MTKIPSRRYGMAGKDGGSVSDQLATALTTARETAHASIAGLPLPALFSPLPTTSLYCVVTPIDDRGRLADRSPIRAMKWQPQQPLTISITQGIVVVVAQSDGAECVTRQRHLRLSARVRHLCRITSGDRLLVAAAPENHFIIVYSMPLLESILVTHHTSANTRKATQ